MGKWSAQRRSGGGVTAYQLAAPGPADWQLTSHTSSSITVDRLGAIPSPANGIRARAVNIATGSPFTSSTQVTTATVSGLSSGATYRVQVAWFNGAVQMSSWSVAITDTLP